MRAFVTGLIVCIAVLSGGQANAAQITNPDWAIRPTAEDMATAYPPLAQALLLEGYAVVACKTAATGTLENCLLRQESPAGLGFGAAALSLTNKFHMKPMLVDGIPTAGGEVRIPINFKLPPRPVTPVLPSPRSPTTLMLARDLVKNFGILDRHADAIAVAWQVLATAPMAGVDPGTRAAGLEALRLADEATRAEALETVARIYAAIFSEEQLQAHLAFSQTSTAHALHAKISELPRPTAETMAEIVFEARKSFCRQTACLSETDFATRHVPTPNPALLTNPDWIQQPDQRSVAGARPAVSEILSIDGYAGLICEIDGAGFVGQCRIYAESPAGLGFGNAALSLTGLYRLRVQPTSSPNPKSVWIALHFPASKEALADGGKTYSSTKQEGRSTQKPSAIARALAEEDVLHETEGIRRLLEVLKSTIGIATDDTKTSELASKSIESASTAALTKLTDAKTAFYASVLSDAQVNELFAYRQSPAGRAFGAQSFEVHRWIEVAQPSFEARTSLDARDRFCKERDCVSREALTPTP